MRNLLQECLNTIQDISTGVIVEDGLIENGVTYYGYTLQETYVTSDLDKNRTLRYTIIGYLVRKKATNENTLSILDAKSEEITNKLKTLNFKVSVEDIDLSSSIEKKKISGYVYTNEINNNLVI